jgi:hypothetical protein
MVDNSILIIGNGPVHKDISGIVESYERVVRFNQCAGLPSNLGKKCTDLWLSSRGREALKVAADLPALVSNELQEVMLTDPPQNRLKQKFFRAINRKGSIDFTELLVKPLEPKYIINRLEKPYHSRVLSHILELGTPEHKPARISSGTIAIDYFLKKYDQISIAGFGFQGWKRHPWSLEKKYVEKLMLQDRIIKLDMN